MCHRIGLQDSKLERAISNIYKRHFAPEISVCNPINHFKKVVPALESRI